MPTARTGEMVLPQQLAQLRAGGGGNDGDEAPALSSVHDLGPFGLLHIATLPEQAMLALRAACAVTPCDHIHPDMRAFFNRDTMDILQQALPGFRVAGSKVPDGYFLSAPDCDHQLLSIIKDTPMCLPVGMDHSIAPPIAPNGARAMCFSLLPRPGEEAKTRVFKLVFHGGFTNLDEVSRMTMADHAIAQIMSQIPLSPSQKEPRVLMESPGVGAFLGQCLYGEQADLVKRAFLGLVAQTASNPSAVYDVPLELSQTLSGILNFKTAIAGQLALTRLKDGIVGYWRRSDGKNTLVLAASSSDFAAKQPNASSPLFLYNMHYADDTGSGPRVFLRVRASAVTVTSAAIGAIVATDCPLKLPMVIPGFTSMDDLVAMVHYFMEHLTRMQFGVQGFPAYCMDEAKQRMEQGEPMDPTMAFATRQLLGEAPVAPASSYASLQVPPGYALPPPQAQSPNGRN